ncbi:unnamed protein product [Callosobruchus maculatus]|uniref:Uncharacterized protein n=1 Tax=Callosobruchus maculatus TaxID=64391 RepID=A0A653CN86_CALMS|nr:unnamed protein product [Callosobruchus maculatus]
MCVDGFSAEGTQKYGSRVTVCKPSTGGDASKQEFDTSQNGVNRKLFSAVIFVGNPNISAANNTEHRVLRRSRAFVTNLAWRYVQSKTD